MCDRGGGGGCVTAVGGVCDRGGGGGVCDSGLDREYGETEGNLREFEISAGHTAVASITLSFSFRFPARLSHVDSGEWMDGWPPWKH